MRAVKLADEWNTLGDHGLDLGDEAFALAGPEWEPGAVKVAMVSAFQVLFETVRMPRPSGAKGWWPDMPTDAKELWEQRRAGTNAVGRMGARIQRTSIEIAQSEIAMGWPMAYLADDHGLRTMFQEWALAQANGIKGRSLCRKRGWSYSTLRERRDRAARIIAQELNRTKVTPW